jgi:hypothetical protein
MSNESRLTEAKRRLLEQMRRGTLTPAAPAAPERKSYSQENPAPLSLAQEQVWRLDQTAGKVTPLHNESITIHHRGECDLGAIQRSLAEIIRRHEIWRTTYETAGGRPVQIIHPAPADFTLPFDDLRTLPEGEREKEALKVATQDARQTFDLKRGPLLRARLVTLRDEEHRLYLTAHQSIVDGITVFDIFPFELATLYEAFSSGRPSPLPELQTQFADFACWQCQTLRGETMEDQLAYWEKQLAGDLAALQWPNNGVRPSQQTYRGAMHSFEFPGELGQSLKSLGRREGATLFMILLAGLVGLLHRYTGQEEILIGTLAPSGRKRSEFQRLMGYFLNPVALRARVAPTASFGSLLNQMREVIFGAISHDDVPLEQIAKRLRLKPDPSRHPFFTVALSVAPDLPQLPPGWGMSYMDVESGGARWDLYIEMSDRAEGLLGRAQYNPDLFTAGAISETVEDFRVLLDKVAASGEW